MHDIKLLGQKAIFCICHTHPFFKLPSYVNLIQTAPFDTDLNAISLYNHVKEKKISINCGIIADHIPSLICEIIQGRGNEVEHVIFLLHRKITCTKPIGIQSHNFPEMWLEAGDDIDVPNIIESYPEQDILIPIPRWCEKGLMAQYASCHIIQDFVELLGICIDSGVLTASEAVEFSQEKVLLWGALVGQMPTKILYKIMKSLNLLMKAIGEKDFRCRLPDHPYQKRCISFFCERLVSFILLQELIRLQSATRIEGGGINIKKHSIGYCCTVSQGNTRPDAYLPGLY